MIPAMGSGARPSSARSCRRTIGRIFCCSLVAASVGDRHGNLVFDKTTANFNPLCAMAGTVTVVEVAELVEPGEIDPQQVHLPGVFVHYVVHAPDPEKRIEKRTVTEVPA